MKAATKRGDYRMGGGRRKERGELREKSLGESMDCNLSARNEQDNIK